MNKFDANFLVNQVLDLRESGKSVEEIENILVSQSVNKIKILNIIENRLTADDFVKRIGDNLTYAKIKDAIHQVFKEELLVDEDVCVCGHSFDSHYSSDGGQSEHCEFCDCREFRGK